MSGLTTGSSSLLICLCIFIINGLILCSESSNDDDDHTHGSVLTRNNFIEDIHEELNLTAVINNTFTTSKTIGDIMMKIGFKNCTTSPSKCSLCVPLDVLLSYHGVSTQTHLNATKTLDILSSIVYLLSYKSIEFGGSVQNFGAVCNTSLTLFPLGSNVTNAFEGVKKQYGGQEDRTISEEVLESALENINDTVGYLLTNDECYNIESVYEGTNIPEDDVNNNNFGLISGFVILKLLKKSCFEEHEHHKTVLPPKTAFIDRLFTSFASNGTMSFVNFENLLKTIGVGTKEDSTTDGHDSHNHRKKRSIKEEFNSLDRVTPGESKSRHRRAAVSSAALGSTCYSPESLLKIYNIDKNQGLNATQFTELCPAIVEQIESGVCKTVATTSSVKRTENGWKPWVSAMVAVCVISLGSLAGIIIAPSHNKPSFKFVLTFMIAIAVSTLLGDGILHLLPHSLDLHKHEESSHGSHNVFAKDSYLWKSLLFIAGVCMFYLFEVMMHVCAPKHRHSHGLDEEHVHIGHQGSRKDSKAKGPLELKSYTNKGGSFKRRSLVNTPAGLHSCDEDNSSSSTNMENGIDLSEEKSEVIFNNDTSEVEEQKGIIKFFKKFSNYRSVVYMVLIGDAIHNFLDGIVIGVAFSEKFPAGFSGGISTSIAIFCHEVPHELGDFAVLVSSGMSIPLALGLNFLSSLTAFFGAIVGVSLGQQWDALPWVFAITAGLFAYIALVDLLPELLHSSELRKQPALTVILQSLGLLIGFAIMFLLAAYEEDLREISV